MPCLVLTGHPCVGKTTIAHLLAKRAKHLYNEVQGQQEDDALIVSHDDSSFEVEIVNEESSCEVNQTKRQCYESSTAEKSTRSTLKAHFDRAVASSAENDEKLIILDSLNYIKGYRYELHCLSKAVGQKHGVLWILNAPSIANEWNTKRSKQSKPKTNEDGTTTAATDESEEDNNKSDYFYTTQQMEELRLRYEPPDERNRWDRPLWTLDLTPYFVATSASTSATQSRSSTTTNTLHETLESSVYNMHSLREATAAAEAAAAAANGVGLSNSVTNSQVATPIHTNSGAAPSKGGGGEEQPLGTSTTIPKKKKSAFRRRKPVNSNKSKPTTINGTASSSLTKDMLDQHHASLPTNDIPEATSATTSTVPSYSSTSSSKKIVRSPQGTMATATTTSPPNDGTTSTTTSLEEQLDGILKEFLFSNKVEALKQGLSTRQTHLAESNVLHDVDTIAQQICNSIVRFQQRHGPNITPIIIEWSSHSDGDNNNHPTEAKHGRRGKKTRQHQSTTKTTTMLELHNPSRRTIPVMALKRYKQSHVQWITAHPPAKNKASRYELATLFVQYVEAQLG